MNRNIGKKFLSVICVGLLVIGISLFYLGKNNDEVEDLYGKRSELGDVNILLQNNKGMYETNEIKIDKDNISIDYMAKQGMNGFNLSKKNIEEREVLEASSSGTIDYQNVLLEDEDRLASVYVTSKFTTADDNELFANIKLKYNDSDKIESYEIPLGDRYDESQGVLYSSVPISIDKNNIYIATLVSYYSLEDAEKMENGDYNEEYNGDYFKNTVLNLYKVDLSNNSSKHILSKEYNGKDIHIKPSVCFANNKKAYFLVNEKDDEGYKRSLFEFDVFTKEINIIDLGIKEDFIRNFSVDDNKLILLDIKKNNSKYIRGTMVDLKNSKGKHLEDININAHSEEVLQVRRINGKIYIITVENGDKTSEDTGYDSYYFTVFDENTNNLLYKGKIKQKTSYMTQVGVVKEDEL
ncbi:MAG: hypothetical protein E6356_16495 [Terrisporobacter othiniensis]|uniref:hypothetical protein n=1 Tax=Terrisporobacter petrolearius TaxID=1460447 RepID=UPI0022E7B2CB|nr:hypothetical protein [Terrisporobacter petrolearius]MDU4859876.1 hypothetical protein [Terrisporobacter othiniensis]MDU6996458.1 hypothetical protein [Terrisporobacter othiniensis]